MVYCHYNMKISKKLCFCLLFLAFFAFFPLAQASADSGRFFVKSTKGFWKNAFGARHEFENGFSAELSDFQVRLARIFGVEIEPVDVLQILPADETAVSGAENLKATATLVPTPSPAKTAKPRITKISKGVIRYTPSDQTPWGIETIYNDIKIASTSGGSEINVAVLDTGVLTSHPDLNKRIAQCKDFTNLRFPVLDNKCEDKNGHGTHVAGIIAADAGADGLGLYGVAPAAKIFAYKVCGSNGSCYADDIAFGLRMAVDQKADIINMSFGADKDIPLIRDAISYASSKGALLVAAAGNDGLQANIDYPAAYESVIGVGAINQTLAVTDWSSRGTNILTDISTAVVKNGDIEFAAPGEYIESTWNNGSYAVLSGTSMASPFVAGLAAKFWQSGVKDSAAATRDLLHSLARDLSPEGYDNASGFGLPQVPK